jgi:hypothetical protein
MTLPQHGDRSPDGFHWYDAHSNSWQPVDPAAAPAAASDPQAAASPGGAQAADDGHSGITKVAAAGKLNDLMAAAEQDVQVEVG